MIDRRGPETIMDAERDEARSARYHEPPPDVERPEPAELERDEDEYRAWHRRTYGRNPIGRR